MEGSRFPCRMDGATHRLHVQRPHKPQRIAGRTWPRMRQARRPCARRTFRRIRGRSPEATWRALPQQPWRRWIQQCSAGQLRGARTELDARLRKDVLKPHGLFGLRLPASARRISRRQRCGNGEVPQGLPPHALRRVREKLCPAASEALQRKQAALLVRTLRQRTVQRPGIRPLLRHPHVRILAAIHQRHRSRGDGARPESQVHGGALGQSRTRQRQGGCSHGARLGKAHRRRGGVHRISYERRGTVASGPLRAEGADRPRLLRRREQAHLSPLCASALDESDEIPWYDYGGVWRTLRPHADLVEARCEGILRVPSSHATSPAAGRVRRRRPPVHIRRSAGLRNERRNTNRI